MIVNMKGIHPNTRDDTVTDYLSKYGKMVSGRVIYGAYASGPLKGLRNGDRSFKVEIKPGENIGTYHIMDGQKVTVRYAGQQQTCARCHKTPQHCMGKGVARNCQAAGGPKVELCDYILELWNRIGYNPGDCDRGDLSGGDGDDLDTEPAVQQQTGGTFTPAKTTTDPTSFSGVRIKSFPEDTHHDEIRKFLVASGLAEQKKESMQIKPNGTVTIMNLSSEECLTLIGVIHHKIHFGFRMFCNGIIPLTPEKLDAGGSAAQATRPPLGAADQTPSPQTSAAAQATSISPSTNAQTTSPPPSAAAEATSPPPGTAAQTTCPPPSATAQAISPPQSTAAQTASPPPSAAAHTGSTAAQATSAAASTVAPATNLAFHPTTSIYSTMVSPSTSLNQSQLDIGAASVITELDGNLLGNEDLLRRYSLSLRDAPCGSIAGDILHQPNLKHRQSQLLNDIRRCLTLNLRKNL